MTGLPWTVVTFSRERGLRTLNTEALIIALIFLLVLIGPGLLLFIGLVLLIRPRYQARWLWPDPRRVDDYAALAAVYVALALLATALIAMTHGGTLLLMPYWFVPLVLTVTYLIIRRPVAGLRLLLFRTIAGSLFAIAAFSLTQGNVGISGLTTGRSRVVAIGILLIVAVGVAIAARTRQSSQVPTPAERVKQQAALPFAYCGIAFLLLSLTSVIPTAAFFKAGFEVELVSFVKSMQMKLARDLRARFWRIAAEYNENRGLGKAGLAPTRREETLDRYDGAVFNTVTSVSDAKPAARLSASAAAFPQFIERILPHYSEASVATRELIHDSSSDGQWSWTVTNGTRLSMMMPALPKGYLTIESDVPRAVIGFTGPLGEHGEAGTLDRAIGSMTPLAVIAILLAATWWIAKFIARRVFLVDLVNPRWFSRGVLGLNHVICYPCDDQLAPTLFADYATIDLAKPEDRARAETLPGNFESPFEEYVVVRGIDYRIAAGAQAELLRGLIERLTRNSDRKVVLRPTSMSVVTNALLQGKEAEQWARTLSSFVWVDGYQLLPDAEPPPQPRASGQFQPIVETLPHPALRLSRFRRIIRAFAGAFGFGAYVEQIIDNRRSAKRTIEEETKDDPYLLSLIHGLRSEATARDQVLDEIGERAETYYTGLWHACTNTEKIVLLQLAQTGLVNEKMRRDVRRLLARGRIRRDPRLRVMNETFRRFVVAQTASTDLTAELEPAFGSDAWERFRVPFFASVGVVLLFFFMTQHELFDVTVAVVTSLIATLPSFIKFTTMWGDRAARSVR
jgi:hypothetical protein